VTSPVDECVLRELRDIMQDDFSELVTVFLQDSAEQYRALVRAWGGGQRDGVYHIAHSMKGCCSNVGATECASLAAELESAVRQGAWTSILPLLTTLEQSLERTHCELRDWSAPG
jgi:histidine phosphotransfer protein HptB